MSLVVNTTSTHSVPPTTSSSSDTATSSKNRYCRRLTDLECQLLEDYEGSFKCRKVFAGHWSTDCPTGQLPLLIADYNPVLTKEVAEAAKLAHLRASAKTITKTMTVAAVFDADSSSDKDPDWALSEYVFPCHLHLNCDVVSALIDHGAPQL